MGAGAVLGTQWDVHKVEDVPKLIKASRRRLASRARYIALALAVGAVVATGLLAPLPNLAPGVDEALPVPARSRRTSKLVRHQWTAAQQPRLVRQAGRGASEGTGRRRRGLELPGGAGHAGTLVSTPPGAGEEGRQAGQHLALLGHEQLPEPDALAKVGPHSAKAWCILHINCSFNMTVLGSTQGVIPTAASTVETNYACCWLQFCALQYPARTGGYWSSGYPRMDLAAKEEEEGFAAGLQLLLLRADLSRLKVRG